MRTVGALSAPVLARSSPITIGLPPSIRTRSTSPPAARTLAAAHSAARCRSAGSPPPVEMLGIRSQSKSSSRRVSGIPSPYSGSRPARLYTHASVPAGPSLYRRHRPRTFADVIGQEHVVRTLRNAIERGQVHHAYLFVGSRGTGKTSMAKMLAACLNCVNGPTIEPCGVCESCVSIASATSMDVIEMDAASNNSVDDIRELRDSVQYAPVTGRYKVYILDEAHMLSNQAWNAFLKTLEEPPPATIFVLATTEANKVMPTVVDRCHRFDFRRPTVDQLATVVQRVAEKETIGIAPDAVALWPGTRRAPTATRWARSSSSSPTRARRSPPRTCSPCSASPTTSSCSARWTPSARGTRARPGTSPRAWPRAAATPGSSSATSRPTRAT